MDQRHELEKSVYDKYRAELVHALGREYETLSAYMLKKGLITSDEVKVVTGSSPSNDGQILSLLELMKGKDNTIDELVSYLRSHNHGGLANSIARDLPPVASIKAQMDIFADYYTSIASIPVDAFRTPDDGYELTKGYMLRNEAIDWMDINMIESKQTHGAGRFIHLVELLSRREGGILEIIAWMQTIGYTDLANKMLEKLVKRN